MEFYNIFILPRETIGNTGSEEKQQKDIEEMKTIINDNSKKEGSVITYETNTIYFSEPEVIDMKFEIETK
ncbi:MAG: hypothetical protein JXM74_03905 [Fusobacteriaceae bacterium]|nr:hypothetical protein [Fusobacteriaceae bacterium]